MHLLIEVSSSVKFLQYLEEDEEAMEEYRLEDAYSVPVLELDNDQGVTQQLAVFLSQAGYALVSFRELVRETAVSYSFVDETPGTETSSVCLHVIADALSADRARGGQHIVLTSLPEMRQNLEMASSPKGVVELGVARILAEHLALSPDRT